MCNYQIFRLARFSCLLIRTIAIYNTLKSSNVCLKTENYSSESLMTITIIQQLKNVVIKNYHEEYVFIREQKMLQVLFIEKCLNVEN